MHRYILGRLSPLLSGVLAVDNGVVGVDVTPQGLISPADSYHFRIDPLRQTISWTISYSSNSPWVVLCMAHIAPHAFFFSSFKS